MFRVKGRVTIGMSKPYWLCGVLIGCSLGLVPGAVAQSVTIDYSYDALARLTGGADSSVGDTTFAYDAAGNRTGVNVVSPPPPPPPPPPPNQPPVALDLHYYSPTSQQWVFHTSQWASDPNGDTLVFSSVSEGALSGGNQYLTVTTSSVPGAIKYINYTASDPYGATDSGTIQLENENDLPPL